MDKNQQSHVYLKPKQYYIDRYDLGTIKECLHYYQGLYRELPKVSKSIKDESVSDDEIKKDWIKMMNMVIVSIKAESFKHKEETINTWMEKDRIKQEKFDNAEPLEIYCDNCNVLMEEMHKSLKDSDENNLQVLFMYNCPKCNKRKAFYDDGKPYESKPTLCEKCGSEIDVSIKINDKKDTTTWTYKCTGCDYKKVEIDDHKKWKKDQDEKETKDKELLTKFRKDFVFSEEEGKEVLFGFEKMKNISEEVKKMKDKEKDPAYQKALNIKKLKVVEVNKLLKEHMEKNGYINLQFEKPDMGRFVAVPFTVQDEKSDREEYNSKTQLRKLIDKTLEPTNWRLMSDGIIYRAGYLNGRFRCYETENDLFELLS